MGPGTDDRNGCGAWNALGQNPPIRLNVGVLGIEATMVGGGSRAPCRGNRDPTGSGAVPPVSRRFATSVGFRSGNGPWA